MAAYVAWTGGNLRARTSTSNSKFPEGVRGINVSFNTLDKNYTKDYGFEMRHHITDKA